MKTNIKNRVETLKETIQYASETSKQTIKGVIESNSQNITNAIDVNKKTIDTLKEKFYSQNLDETLIDPVNKTFGKSVRLAEDIIDSIIDAHNKRIQSTIDSSIVLIDELKEQEFRNEKEAEKLLNIVQKNFEDSIELSTQNLKSIIDAYNKHLNLALNFNDKLADNIKVQVDLMVKLQNNSMTHTFNNWVSEWKKQTVKEMDWA